MKVKNYLTLKVFVFLSCIIMSCGDKGNQILDALKPAFEVITPEQEYYIGRSVAANIIKQYSLYKEDNLTGDALTQYLNKICAAITINSPRPDVYNGYHVAILNSEEVNAFSTPGGHIFVTLGLIRLAKDAGSEDALAGVIAHEVAHIQLQHGIKAIQTDRLTKALIITAVTGIGAATGMDFNDITNVFIDTVGDIFNNVVNDKYSRQQEFEADTKALSLLKDAGYNQSGLMDMLNKLPENKFGGTHPTRAERIANATVPAGTPNTARKTRFDTALNSLPAKS